MNMLRAWWAECKLYIFGFMLIAAIGYHFWYGHEQRKAGKAQGDKEVAALKAQYATASQQAVADAAQLQATYDAQAIASAQQQAQTAQIQSRVMQNKADAAQRSAEAFKAKLHDLRKHDPGVNDLLDTPLPAGVRAAGQG